MTLRQKQSKFMVMLGQLISEATRQGFEMTGGELYRTPEQAALNAKKGTGISNSLHGLKLAIDIQLFKDGVYLVDSTKYLPLGVWWESIGGSWGGRFSKPDGNHFSTEWNGVK